MKQNPLNTMPNNERECYRVLGKSRNLTIAIYIDRKTGGKIYDYMLL